MFFRSIINSLKQWAINPARKPLVLRGARQVGKTTAVHMFSREFGHYIYLNLEKPEDVSFFKQKMPVHEIIAAIFFSRNIKRNAGKTLIFIDEIQNSPEAVTLLRYFYEEAPDLYIIAAGSLLETLINRHISFPVGRVEYMFMKPLSFEEYLKVLGEEESLALLYQLPLPEYAHQKLLKLFHTYTLIGGMPEIIKKFIETGDIITLNPLYQNLFITYMDDVEKYARNDRMARVLRHTIESVPFEARKRIKFHGFGKSSYSSREISEALKTLEKAMLVSLVYPTTSLEFPIMPDYKKSPKLQFLDTGLINFFAGLQQYYFNLADLSAFYQGIVAEHIVGQELDTLLSSQIQKVHFWVREKKQSNAELDFLLPFKKYLIPVEVKSGKSGTLKSLHQFINRSQYTYAVRFYSGKLNRIKTKTPEGKEYILLNMPYFLTSRIYSYAEWLIED